jgi:hypothetical protein
MAITFRPLLCGTVLAVLCLFALQPGAARAQTVAVALDRSPGDSPLLIDESSNAPGNIPEIIRPTDAYGDMLGSRAITDPGSALTPPSIDHGIFASERRP